MKTLVIFGSTSDENIYNPIVQGIPGSQLRVLSAHRTPEALTEVLKQQWDLVIAGAGLAAHLPGVAASKVIVPVIGVPCNGNFQGLDALLSVMQMPPGIPVLSVGVNGSGEVVRNVQLLSRNFQRVVVIGEENNSCVQRCVGILEQFHIPFEFQDEFDTGAVNIRFVRIDDVIDCEHFVINVLLMEGQQAENSIPLLDVTNKGLWVGVNRGENAALAAAALLKKYEEIHYYRQQMKQKVLNADKGVHHAVNV